MLTEPGNKRMSRSPDRSRGEQTAAQGWEQTNVHVTFAEQKRSKLLKNWRLRAWERVNDVPEKDQEQIMKGPKGHNSF